MSYRACAYRNCENLYIDNRPAGNFTIFAFPKDTKRAQRWRELGCVDDKIPINQCFMCSDHFDPKFLSLSCKRKLLLGAAEPYPYENKTINKQPTKKQQRAQENYVINLESAANDEQLKVESTTTTLLEDLPENGDIHQIELILDNTRGSKEATYSVSPPKAKRSRLMRTATPSNPAPSTATENPCNTHEQSEESLINKIEVSTFIFKGEEYVQMSKAFYLLEKRDLLQKLQSYEQILGNIKEQVQLLPL